METETVRVKLIEIEGLFRQYDHRIELKQEDHVTVLHGRNGVGKSVTLALVAAVLQGRFDVLFEYPFKRMRIEFDDGSFIEPHEKFEQVDKRYVIGNSGKRIPLKRRIFEIRYTLAGGPSHSFLSTRGSTHVDPSEPLVTLLKRIQVHLIEAQRLHNISRYSAPKEVGSVDSPMEGRMKDDDTITSAVEGAAKDMAQRLAKTDSMYRETSTRLDVTLPSRLFGSAPKASHLSGAVLAKRSALVELERSRLREIGLLEDTNASFDPKSLDKTQQAMFAVYLADAEEKLRVFRDVADRAQILLEIINQKFAPKSVKLDIEEGYSVRTHDRLPLELDRLSSGEQHEIVLLHDLLFRVEPGSLLLIDEPELSLHVTWQTEFLADLIRIAKKVGFDAILATHSPYIVGSRRDLMVQLGEPA